MIMMRQVPLRYGPRKRLGAEELIELGQASRPAPPVPSLSTGRTVSVTAEEARLMILVTENIVSFANDYAIEFHSYCPVDRWQKALTDVGTWTHEMERQVKAGAPSVTIPEDVVFQLVDLEKCVSAARDARLTGARAAFTLSAIGAFADFIFGITWLGVPAYIAGLAILLGRPLIAKYSAQPQEPYRPSLSGADDCAKVAGTLGDHTDKAKILERVIVAAVGTVQRHHWGSVMPRFGPVQSATCLSKDKWRVRVEGWLNDVVTPGDGWSPVPMAECRARKEICVWCPRSGAPRETPWGRIPQDSGFEETYWVEYVGPKTAGLMRRAGPFG